MLNELFVINNYPGLYTNPGWDKKLLLVLKLYGVMIVAMIAYGPILVLADQLVTGVFHHKSFNAHYKQVFQQLFKKAGVGMAALFICLVGPVFEETIFRLPLSFKKRQVAIAAGVAICYVAGRWINTPSLMIKAGIEIALALAVTGLCFLLMDDTPFQLSYRRKQQLIALSICVFGLMHISNYKPLDWPLVWLYPVFVIPQLLIGWGVTYIRFKHGFMWGIALHVLVNSVSTLLSLLVRQ